MKATIAAGPAPRGAVRPHGSACVAVDAPLPTRRGAERARDGRAAAMLSDAVLATQAERRRIQQRVVLDYLELADAVANRFRSAMLDRGDLRQVAYLGLIKAVQGFDPSIGTEIASFAVPTISGEIKRYLRDCSWAVRPPRALQELALEIAALQDELAQRLGREASVEELAAKAGCTEAEAREAQRCGRGRRSLSLDAPLQGDDDHTTFAELLAADDAGFERMERRLPLSDALATLDAKEQRIVFLRFFRDLTQDEIAAELGMSQMQVSRQLRRILRTLRQHLEASSASTH